MEGTAIFAARGEWRFAAGSASRPDASAVLMLGSRRLVRNRTITDSIFAPCPKITLT